MVSRSEVVKQLKKIGFNYRGWGRTEISELPNILLPGEEIYECVNGIYDGGFALLLATDIRVLLVDKKPLSYLTVEDMRFDMISEMDFNHRLLMADIGISSGDKNLRFKSFNKMKLRKLIGHVQHCMAEVKKQESNHQDSQVSHLEQINKQLQTYLMAQYQYQVELQGYINNNPKTNVASTDPPKPNRELADYLYAQSLLEQYNNSQKTEPESGEADLELDNNDLPNTDEQDVKDDIYEEGAKEIFGNAVASRYNLSPETTSPSTGMAININPKRIAFSKLPIALRLRQKKLSKTTGRLIRTVVSPNYD